MPGEFYSLDNLDWSARGPSPRIILKCLIPLAEPPFCPDKIVEIWAFLSDMTPDRSDRPAAGSPICPNILRKRKIAMRHIWTLLNNFFLLEQVAYNYGCPWWNRPASVQPAILSVRPPTSLGPKWPPTWHHIYGDYPGPRVLRHVAASVGKLLLLIPSPTPDPTCNDRAQLSVPRLSNRFKSGTRVTRCIQ